MDSMIKMLGDALTPELLGSIGGVTGESERGTKSAVDGMIPALVGALTQKGSSESGAQGLLDMMGQSQNGLDLGDVASGFAGLIGDDGKRDSLMGAGDGILSALLPGNKLGKVLDLVSGASGLKKSSSSSMMRMIAPLAMGLLRRYAMKKGLGALGLSNFLGGQKEFVRDAAPAGLSGILGMDSWDGGEIKGTADRTVDTRRKTTQSPPPQRSGGGLPKWLLPLLGLLVLLGLLGFALRQCGDNDTNTDTENTTQPTAEADSSGSDAASGTSFCGVLGTLDENVNGLPEIVDGINLSEYTEGFGAVAGSIASLGAVALQDNISIDLLQSAGTTLSDLVGSINESGGVVSSAGDIDLLQGSISDVKDVSSSLATGNGCE